jgi:hypothetical protein
VGALGFGTCRFPVSTGRASAQISIDDMFKPKIESHRATASKRRHASRRGSHTLVAKIGKKIRVANFSLAVR